MTLSRPGRVAAVAGSAVAIAAAALMAIAAGNALAEEPVPGHCTDNVNVREEPNVNSRIIDVCKAGQKVQVGERQNGFVRLVDLGGWSAEQYVAVDEPREEPKPKNENTTEEEKSGSEEGAKQKEGENAEKGEGDHKEESGRSGGEKDAQSKRPGGLLS